MTGLSIPIKALSRAMIGIEYEQDPKEFYVRRTMVLNFCHYTCQQTVNVYETAHLAGSRRSLDD